jgi:deazaflavin-dependent oxidoreductase (nitroreductase family)
MDPMAALPTDAGGQPYAWLTTVGRITGQPRTVELWFLLDAGTLYFLAGGGERAAWVRNAVAQPDVRVRLGGATYRGRARSPESGSDEDQRVRRGIAAKYQGWTEGRPLSRWAATSFCLAVDLLEPETDAPPPDPSWTLGG